MNVKSSVSKVGYKIFNKFNLTSLNAESGHLTRQHGGNTVHMVEKFEMFSVITSGMEVFPVSGESKT
jgi:hypothetical protein